MSGDEAFPNSEELLKQALSADEPLPPLLSLLKQHPTHGTVRDLVVAYTEAVEADPARGQRLASALLQLGSHSDAPTKISTTDSLNALIDRELADFHFKWVGVREGPHSWGPENRYLLESHLSELSLKNGLTSTCDMLAAADDGLNATRATPYAQEVVVGACFQLLLAGFFFVSDDAGSYKRTPGAIAAKLKTQKESGIVKERSGIRVLEVRDLDCVRPGDPFNQPHWMIARHCTI